ncbi:MAG TPA: hypothetical protein DDZ88_29980 [Verrucomicrobiales bacterium]|nr:hypothetical protein [Verrucomicrobiales bacterium]
MYKRVMAQGTNHTTKETEIPKDWSSKDIRKACIDADVTYGKIAKELGVARDTVGKITRGQAVSDRVRHAVARALGVSVKDIWPSVYLSGGPRKRGREFGSKTKRGERAARK